MKNKTYTKAVLSVAVGILLTVTLCSFIPVSGEEEIYSDVVRLHVIAESDSREHQELKLSVRDAVLTAVEGEISGVTERERVLSLITAAVPKITAAAEARVAELGYDCPVTVYFDREEYPLRYYEDYVLPAGEYTSLRVVLGEGEGRNWWCVLFPSMCRSAATETGEEEFYAAGFTPEEYRIIRKDSAPKYKVRFRFLELIASAFGFDR